MLQKLFMLFLFSLLTACVNGQSPLEPKETYYNATLKLSKPYVYTKSKHRFEIIYPEGNYLAAMKDERGVYFAAPSEYIIKYDNEKLAFFGGFYYQTYPSVNIYMYTQYADGVQIRQDAVVDLNNYKIIRQLK